MGVGARHWYHWVKVGGKIAGGLWIIFRFPVKGRIGGEGEAKTTNL